MGDGQQSDTEATRHAQTGKKFRRTLSCLNCQKRKVKCDRVKPCRACCTRGAPSKCEYGTTKKDRRFIEQSDLIEKLRQRCKQLEEQLTEAKDFNKTSSSTPNSTEGRQTSRSSWHAALSMRPLAMKGTKNAESTESKSVISTPPSSGKALLEVFLGDFVEACSPQSPIYSGIGFDMRAAAEMRIFSPLLSKAFEAASLIFISQRHKHPKIEAVGNAQYSGVLKLLQRAVNDPEQCKSTEVLTVVVLVAVIEAFKQSLKDSIFKHQQGGLALMRLRTAYRHRLGLDRSLYVGLRLFWVTSTIVSRRATFLASKEWITVPWPENGPQKDILHHLLDIAVDIPAYLGAFDSFKAALRRGTLATPEAIASSQAALWKTATELDARLQLWNSIHASTYPMGYMGEIFEDTVQESENGPESKFPLFRCRNLATGELVTPPILVYPDQLLALSMCLYWALRLVITAVDDSGLVAVLTPHERYKHACDICRSMKYYVSTSPGLLISRIMFPLRVAFDTFSDGMVEKKFIQELFLYIGNKFRLQMFKNSCTDSAVWERGRVAS
ncbi:hypothetical protein VTN77DRAFT_8479 [Rasamsonia byssochlamydoides]|uniref:uncharacterized protein n=1 Tax=Rasamsonia byssochlamydoides TaxID=89139 RepID=UPI0037444BB5